MVLLWFLLIFLLSNQVAENSSAMSGGISDYLWRLLNKIINGVELDLDLFNHYIRKTAHFTLYFILGVLVYHGFYQIKQDVSNKYLLIAWMICIGYAISDEVHQYFIPGRSMQFTDVVIDSIGALLGLVLVMLIRKYLTNRKKRNDKTRIF